MKLSILKALSTTLLILIITMSAFMASNTNLASAATVQYLPTYARVSPIPNPVGVGQQMLVSVGLQPVPPASSLSADKKYLWNDMTVNVIKPDGHNDTIGPLTSDPTGSTYATYVPSEPGNYTFQLVFPGQWMNYTSRGVEYNNYYYGSVSLPEQGQVTVQEEKVPAFPSYPLPTGYWTVPLSGEFKGANCLVDNWLMPGYDYTSRSFTIAGTFAPYTDAPDSPHVLWTTPIRMGGVMGGPYGDDDYYTGLAYEQFYAPLIIQGEILYTDHGPTSTTAYGTRCLDLYTGEQLWYFPGVTFAFAQVLEMDTPNEHGGLPYLWSTSGFGANQTWSMYDAFSANTGQPPQLVCTVTNVTSGSAARRGAINFGPNGEILAYYLSSTAAGNWLSMWNSTLAIMGPPGPAVATWSPRSSTVYDGNQGIEWNVTLPDFTQPISIMEASGGYILASNTSGIALTYAQMQMAFPATLKRNSAGNYPTTLNPLWVENRSVYMSSYKFSNVNDGAYAQFDEQTSVLYCYNVTTGEQMWAADPLTTPWGVFSGYALTLAYGNIYQVGYDGHCRAYSVATGDLVWDFYQGSSGYETPYGTWPSYWGMNIADGKVFYSNDEHSPDANLWRGGEYICLNANNGDVIFRMAGQLHEGAVSDSYYTAQNNYDGLAYTIGKGPSKTTVSAPQTVVPQGTGVLITGTVTDQSPGAPNTPAISDANMSAWMEYLYQQKPIPENAIGVPVTVFATDSAGQTTTIGTVTSDNGGSFGITWNPDNQGTYKITAQFSGTASYGDSYATTYVSIGTPSPTAAPVSPTPTPVETATPTPTTSVSPSPSPSTPPPPGGFPMAEIYIIIAAVVIVAVIAGAALVLRRRK